MGASFLLYVQRTYLDEMDCDQRETFQILTGRYPSGIWLTCMRHNYYSCFFHLAPAEFRPTQFHLIHFHVISSVISPCLFTVQSMLTGGYVTALSTCIDYP
jgi:hypothetical protein